MLIFSAGGWPAASTFLLLVQKKGTKEKDTLDPGLTVFGSPRSSKKWALAVNSVALLPQTTARVVPFFLRDSAASKGVSPPTRHGVSRSIDPLRRCRGAEHEAAKPRRCLSERGVWASLRRGPLKASTEGLRAMYRMYKCRGGQGWPRATSGTSLGRPFLSAISFGRAKEMASLQPRSGERKKHFQSKVVS